MVFMSQKWMKKGLGIEFGGGWFMGGRFTGGGFMGSGFIGGVMGVEFMVAS